MKRIVLRKLKLQIPQYTWAEPWVGHLRKYRIHRESELGEIVTYIKARGRRFYFDSFKNK